MPPAIVKASHNLGQLIRWMLFPLAIAIAVWLVVYSLKCNNQLDIKHHPREIRPTSAG